MEQTTARSPDTDTPRQLRGSVSLRTYQAELPADVLDPQGELLDWVIGYAFDTLDAAQLTLRVTAAARTCEQSAGML